MQQPLKGLLAAIFSESVSKDLQEMYYFNGGELADRSKNATWFFATGDLRVVAADLIFEMVDLKGRVYAPNYALTLSRDGEVVPASAVFDLNHEEFGPSNLILWELTPPSPFTPRPRHRAPIAAGGTKQKSITTPEIIDLTKDDDNADAMAVAESLHPDEETKASLRARLGISPRKKVKL
ncbi:hypothetical protein FB451DRAFT_1232868 [Mycena latifolia]|nr:hypothetical protein FB451DRAFT_1232868 [Mycena latifolia]